MDRKRFTISVTDKDVAEWLEKQANTSAYIRRLVEADMTASGPVPDQGRGDNHVVLDAILEELRLLRQDLSGRAIVSVPDGPRPFTGKSPAGLEKQLGKFREGQR